MITAPEVTARGVDIQRQLSSPNIPVFDTVTWEYRDAVITNMKGATVFEQKQVKVPSTWSQTATNIVASKYLHGKVGTEQREKGVDDLIYRVANQITDWGRKDGYFDGMDASLSFRDELLSLLVHQYAAFNSPVWFNVGCQLIEPDSKTENWHWNFKTNQIEYGMVGYTRPQVSACFINGIKDDMRSILGLSVTEGMLFKWGSGSGINMSALRSEGESLAGGGTASGPLSFMKGFDAFAGVIKSGGKTRRAAKMVMLNADHPDIEAFIECKQKEEAKAHALIAAGYDGSGPDSEAYASIFFQNANNSVRVSDAFMTEATSDDDAMGWDLKSITTGETLRTVNGSDLLNKIAKATWASGDPGMQYDSTINFMHTCKESGRINASNPCSEYMFLDDTACNLASLNLRKFMNPDGSFNVPLFQHAVRILILAMDILVDNAGYPTEEIAKNSHDYRPLGLGYANLGAMLMELGIPYDSVEGRDMAAGITSLMTATAYLASAELAGAMPTLPAATPEGILDSTGTFPGYLRNEASMRSVMAQHAESSWALSKRTTQRNSLINKAGLAAWKQVLPSGRESGYRNAQVTVLAPTGTIGFLMDCDTTGVEPMLGLVVHKKLVGGGYMQLANETMKPALDRLGYKAAESESICAWVRENGTVEGSLVVPEHIAVFDCALKPFKGKRSISATGHMGMMAAVQPFLSGAISKTINMPEEATVEDIRNAYIYAWKAGLKSVAIYRDGSKKNQILTVKKDETKPAASIEGLLDESQLIPFLRHTVRLPPSPDLLQALFDVFGVTRPSEVPEELKKLYNQAYGQGIQTPPEDLNAPPKANRHRLPDDRNAVTHKFTIAQHEGYLTVGLYANGEPGEIFITMSKEGSTMSGLMDCFATVVSVALQHGVPLKTLINKLAHTRFEPSGWSHESGIGYANSIMDYIFRWLDLRFVQGKQIKLPMAVGVSSIATPEVVTPVALQVTEAPASLLDFGDAPACSNCGAIMSRNGACYRCSRCGTSNGCS